MNGLRRFVAELFPDWATKIKLEDFRVEMFPMWKPYEWSRLLTRLTVQGVHCPRPHGVLMPSLLSESAVAWSVSPA